MRCYLIQDHRVTALHSTPVTLQENSILIAKARDLDMRRFPSTRLVGIWNDLPGVAAVHRFSDRRTALKRLWAEFGKLPLPAATSKQAQIIALLQRKDGCTMDDLTMASGWQPHSVRGLISGTLRKKHGLTVESAKSGNCRVYRIPA